jgi:carboxyl-terminal processing protease
VSRPADLARYGGAFFAGVAVTVLLGATDPYAGLDVFARVLSDVDAHYERELPLLDLVHAALDGVPAALDEHSDYFPPDEWARLRQAEAGLAVGIGIEGVDETCGFRVTAVEPWGPAEKVGVHSGDCLEGASAASLPGPMSTAVRFTIVRGEARTETVALRGVPSPPAVEASAVGKGVWYARVRQLRDDVALPLAAALPARPAPRGLVLDLRDNPGGRVEEAGALVDRFVREGVILTTQVRGEPDAVVRATPSASDWSFPVVVIVNGDTASAAEIVAGALQDFRRATLVGTATWGKGSVLRFFQYEDGSALKLTVGRYHLPSGRTVPDHVGLAPDEVVVGAPDWPADRRAPMADRLVHDPQLAAAVRRLQSAISQPDR